MRRARKVAVVASLVAALALVAARDLGARDATARDVAAHDAAPPIVLVVAVDGLRPDRLGCYGGTRVHAAPLVDVLCRDGVAFAHAYAQSSWGPASLASLLAGTHAGEHGVAAGGDRLAPEHPTLASVLAAAGFTTAAWSSDPDVAARGLLRGFRDVGGLARGAGGGALRFEPSEGIAVPVLGWIADHHHELVTRGTLLFVHLDVAQLGRLPPPGYVRRFVAPADAARAAALTARVAAFDTRFAPDELALLGEVADAGLALADAAVGRIVDALRAPELARRTWVVVLAPYGEALGEHGVVGHGTTLYEEAIHVPLVFAPPADRRGRRRVDAVVELADVAPTVLDLAGLPPEPAFRGRSLRPALDGAALAGRDAVAELVAPNPLRVHARATITPGLEKRLEASDGSTRAVDLRADPTEAQSP